MTVLVGREIIFFLASFGAVMQLKCGSTALGIANHFNSLNTEDEVLAFRILCGSAKISAYSPWKPLPLIHPVCPCLQLIQENNVVSLNHVLAWQGGARRFLSTSEEQGEWGWGTKMGEVDQD